MPLGDGPRDHPLLKDLNLGPLGNGARGNPLVTATLLFVSQSGGGIGNAQARPVGDRPSPSCSGAAEASAPSTRRRANWSGKKNLPRGPAGTPMTYSHAAASSIALAIGAGVETELIAFALP